LSQIAGQAGPNDHAAALRSLRTSSQLIAVLSGKIVLTSENIGV
jgi:hypothetical protein